MFQIGLGWFVLLSCLSRGSDPELTNYKSGIDVNFGGIKGVDYCEEYFYHDKKLDDHKVVYVRDSTLISMAHNERNVAFDVIGTTGRMRLIGVDGLDGVANSGDEGIIRYKIDRDQQYHWKWSDNEARKETDRILPAYSGPFSLASQYFEPGIPVVGTTGPNGGMKGDRSGRYFRGCLDSFGDEWHVLAYADDDNVFQRAKYAATGLFIDQAWYSSDGKSVLLVVNPKTPCLTIRTTGTGQFYTSKPKAYWTPKIADQITYLSPGLSGTVSIELRDIFGNSISYRLNGQNWIHTAQSTVKLEDGVFNDGDNLVEYYYEGQQAHTKQRHIVKNPIHPSSGEKHGKFLWGDDAGYAKVLQRLKREPYLTRYSVMRNRADFSGQDVWDENAYKGNRFIGTTTSLTSNSQALVNAFVAKVEGWNFVRNGGTKPHGLYAKQMLLDSPRTIDPLGFEMFHTSDAIPSREVHYRGYYDAAPTLATVFAYDIMIANFRSDQVVGGITPVEDYFIRDTLAGFSFEAMQWAGGMCALGEPGMWGAARMMTASHVAMILSNYSTPYFGTSGFGAANATYPFCPFEDDRLTWKKALFDGNAPRSAFPNYCWGLGLSDDDPSSIFLSENQLFGGRNWPLATWRNKEAYFSSGLMGQHLMVWANMARLYGGGKSDPRLELAFERAAAGAFFGATTPNEVGTRHGLLLLLNSRWPKIVKANLDWVRSFPATDQNSASRQLQDAGVFGFVWYDDEALKKPLPPSNFKVLERSSQ